MSLNPIEIETPRLNLSGYSPEDMTTIFENFSKSEIMKMLGHATEEDYQAEEYKYKNGYSAYNRSFILFLLSDKSSGKIIGRCGLHNWNKDHKRAEIGYHLSEEKYKRKGFMTEAVSAILDYGFNILKLHRIEALVGINNTPSLKIIERYKFIKEGHLRKHYYIDGNYVDSILFSLLSEEYMA